VEDKDVVACVGIAGAVAIAVTDLVMKGPDSLVIGGILSLISFIVGVAFGVTHLQAPAPGGGS